MKRSGRYATSELVEGQFEPGSRGRVLRNLLAIKGKRAMDKAESEALVRTFTSSLDLYDKNYRFKAADLCDMHNTWFSGIYAWAGKYRQVNLAKGVFTFAAAHLIPRLMADFEQKYLAVYTPCHAASKKEIMYALAIVHVELLLIHPFREGNGRLARMLASIMALQAELPPLDFSILKGKKKQEYFVAVQAGISRNYEPMEKTFEQVLEKTLRLQSRSFR